MTETKRRYNRMVWFKQFLPRTMYTIYREEDGSRWFSIWRQWLWRVYDHRRIPITDNFHPGNEPARVA